jgi:enamine deaminase RidA (YjgF/YER057c/UK114 family)
MAQAVRVGSTVYVSGQVALDEHGDLVGRDDIRAQAELAFRNIGRALAAFGGGLGDVVKLTTLIRADADFQGYLEAKGRAGLDSPASTAVLVADLAIPGCLIEIEAIAALGDGKT